MSDPSPLSPVVVTGANGRLGRLVVEGLVASGALVAALDRETPDLAGAFGVSADASDEGAVVSAFNEIEHALGTPRALVHTVGMWDGAPLTETTLESWEGMLRVNLTSAFVCFREAVRRMQAAGVGGSLLAIASGQGADRGVAQQAGYSASKAGVVRLVEATAAEGRTSGIAAVAVAPSTILYGDEADGTPGVRADDVAALCVRLCGPEAAVHSGATLRAYGSAG